MAEGGSPFAPLPTSPRKRGEGPFGELPRSRGKERFGELPRRRGEGHHCPLPHWWGRAGEGERDSGTIPR